MKQRLKNITLPIVAILFLASSCGQNADKSGRASREWKVMDIGLSNIDFDNKYPTTIRGKQDVEIRPQISGTITRLAVIEGEQVKAGQLLFVIDQTPYKAALLNADASLKSAQAALATAQLNYSGNQELRKENVISDFELQQSRNALLSAEAAVAQAEAIVTTARANFAYTEVKSPCDGVVGTLPYRQGALVSPDIAEPLTTVSDNSQMDAYFSIDENALLALMQRYGSTDSILKNFPEVDLLLNDGSIYKHKGKVESISGVVDRNTGTSSIRVRFPNPSRLLHSGISGNLLIKSSYSDAVVIPQSATIKIQDRFIVYKLVDGKAVQTFITVAPNNNGTEYIVIGGLKTGDKIISDGVGLVRDGQEIKIED